MGITGTWSLGAIPIERRCALCDERLGLNETSPCEKCTPRKQRGATRSQLAYRERLFGVGEGGTTRSQMFSAVQREIAAYDADVYKAGRDARAAKKGGLR